MNLGSGFMFAILHVWIHGWYMLCIYEFCDKY